MQLKNWRHRDTHRAQERFGFAGVVCKSEAEREMATGDDDAPPDAPQQPYEILVRCCHSRKLPR